MVNSGWLRVLEWIAALTGALDCLAVAILFSLNQSTPGDPFANLWPVPGLYFLELIALAALAIAFVAKEAFPSITPSGQIPWISAGILVAFVILGAWSIGPFLLPALLSFLMLGILGDFSSHPNTNRAILPVLLLTLLILSLAIFGAWSLQSPLIVTITILVIGLLVILLLDSLIMKNAVFRQLAYLVIGGFAQTLVIYLFIALRI